MGLPSKFWHTLLRFLVWMWLCHLPLLARFPGWTASTSGRGALALLIGPLLWTLPTWPSSGKSSDGAFTTTGRRVFLEQVQDWRPNGTASSEVPGYFLNDHAVVIGRHVRHWYGREPEGSYTWTSFKVLIQEKRKPERSRKEIGAKVVSAQPWHLDTAEMDSCWAWDMTGLPMATYMVGAANGGGPGFETYVGPDLSKAAYDSIEAAEQLGSQGLMARGRAALEVLTAEFDTHIGARQREAYEDTQLGLRLVDWLLAYLGCPDPEQDFAPWPMKIEPGWGRFAETWSDDRVNRVYTRIRETFEEPLPLKHQDPFICGARRLIGERCAPVNRRQFVTHQATV
mmetsp:Transcript_76420/g.175080  ORF Transcript_76420/g.175080 Transcript_76420/m.175080 type:complete len:341 (+) Transcript_76420:1709-2731(+)